MFFLFVMAAAVSRQPRLPLSSSSSLSLWLPPPKCNFSSPPVCFRYMSRRPHPQRLRKSAPKSFPPTLCDKFRSQNNSHIFRNFLYQRSEGGTRSSVYGCCCCSSLPSSLMPGPPAQNGPPRAGPTLYLAPHVKTCVVVVVYCVVSSMCVQKPHARACNLKSVRFARGWSLLHTGHLLKILNGHFVICKFVIV